MSFPESLPRDELRRLQLGRLKTLVRALVPANPFWTARLAAAGVDPDAIRSLDDLKRIPPLTKNEFAADQLADPPYGTNLTGDRAAFTRMHQTSGTTGQPLRWLDTPESWNWFAECWAQIYRLVGLRPRDRLAFPFSFGPFIGFWAAFEAATRAGRFCIPLGGMSSEARLRAIVDHAVTVVCCTPTYALRLGDVAQEIGVDLAASAVRALIVAGEPGGSLPAVRRRIEAAWGARVFDHWGMTEVGSLAIEPDDSPGVLEVLESECLAEVVDPASHEPVASGGPGELWITNLGRAGSPVLRYRTGDLVQVDPSPSPAGRALLRLAGGIVGRVDDMITVRGNNVYPSHLEAILREFPEIVEYRITVETQRAMQHLGIEIEPSPESDARGETPALLERVRRGLKDRLHFQVDVTAVPPGTLPRFEMKGRRIVRKNA